MCWFESKQRGARIIGILMRRKEASAHWYKRTVKTEQGCPLRLLTSRFVSFSLLVVVIASEDCVFLAFAPDEPSSDRYYCYVKLKFPPF